jgi:hypothetical protein
MVDEIAHLRVVLDMVLMAVLVKHLNCYHTRRGAVLHIPRLAVRILDPHHKHSEIHPMMCAEELSHRKKPIDQLDVAFLEHMVSLLVQEKASMPGCDYRSIL